MVGIFRLWRTGPTDQLIALELLGLFSNDVLDDAGGVAREDDFTAVITAIDPDSMELDGVVGGNAQSSLACPLAVAA